MADFDDVDSASQVTDYVNFGEPRSGTTSPESGYVTAMSDFAGDVDSEPDEPSLPSGVHLDMLDCADSDSVSQVSDYVTFGEPRSGTTSPESGYVTAISDFAGDVDSEPDEPSLPSGVHLDMLDCADSDSVSQVSDYVTFGEPRSGTTSPESGYVTAISDFAGDVDSEPDEPSLPSGVHLDMLDCADIDSVSHVSDYVGFGEPRPGTNSPESGSMTAMSDFVSDFDPGPGVPLQGSAVIFGRQNFVSNCEQMQTWDFVYFIRPEHGEASPESGDQIPDNSISDGCHSVRCTLQPDPGGGYISVLAVRTIVARFMMFIVALLQSVWFGRSRQKFAQGSWCRRMSVSSAVWVVGSITSVSALSVRLVFARSTILMFIVALLQSVWFGRLRQQFAPGSWCRRKLVSPEVCDTGSCAGPSGGPSFGIRVVLCAFMAARVQFDPGGPKFVTAHASRTLVSTQPQLDVIQLCLSSSRSGWLSLLSGAGMFPSAASVSLRRDFLCIIRTILRHRLRAQKGPLYDYACVRSEYTNGHQTVIDEGLFSGTCCMWCLDVLRCCAGLSDRVFRCFGSHHIPRDILRDIPRDIHRDMSPGVVQADVTKMVAADAAYSTDAGIPFPADPVGTLSLTDQDGTLSPTDIAGILFPAVPAGMPFPAGPVGTLSPSDSDSVGPVGPDRIE